MTPFSFRFVQHLADGYGRSGFMALRGLREIGAPVEPARLFHEVPQLPPWALALLERRGIPTKWDLLHATPEALQFFPNPHRAIWTMWEGIDLPARWRYCLLAAPDVPIIVPTVAGLEPFHRAELANPMYVCPLAVDTQNFTPVERSLDDVFTVIHWSSLIPRKCPEEMVRVFQEAFPTEKNVRLVIKTRPSIYVKPFVLTANDPRISVLNQDMTPEELNTWVGKAHAGLFLSHGEGFYLEPLEAALTGLPCVVPTHTGCSAWSNPFSFFPVPTACIEKNPSTEFGLDQHWFTMDYDEAARQLRSIYDDYGGALTIGRRARNDVLHNYAPAVVAKHLVDVLEAIDRAD